MDDKYSDDSKGIVDLVSKVRDASNHFILDELKEEGLDGIVPAHGQLLLPLFRAGKALPLGEIVKSSGRAKSTITGMADTLEKKGYIRRHSCPDDKRSVLVELTDRGRDMEARFFGISDKLMEVIFRDITPEEGRIVAEGLKKIEASFLREKRKA